MEAGRLFSIMADFRKRRHLEFLIWLLIGFNLWRPSWIWETIEPAVLEIIAYCLSRLPIGYLPYEPCILLVWVRALAGSSCCVLVRANLDVESKTSKVKTCIVHFFKKAE